MKEYFQKRERVFHLISLGIIGSSVFTQEVYIKFTLVFVGILGLILLSYIKGNQKTMFIYIALLAVALGILFFQNRDFFN
ncbi:MAG: hypothetical protein Q4G16_04915 [Cruoricaptor ignavus]|nr:hypothetical protein [Cruoricaptor ignavus]